MNVDSASPESDASPDGVGDSSVSEPESRVSSDRGGMTTCDPDPSCAGDSDEECIQLPKMFGKYRILGLIGRGGMGLVWRGFDPDLQRAVAIKVLGERLAHSSKARRRFRREARAAAAISHPHVVTVYGVEEQGDVPYMIMEYVDGGSLTQFIESRGKLDPAEVVSLGCQIAEGLAAAHAQGVIHRDVKPSNIMLCQGSSAARIADFGLARVAFDNVELTSHDQWVGTPAYLAPETLRGEQADARSDLFSLGCVLYLMLTGVKPFQARIPAEVIHQILSASPTPLHEVLPDVPLVLSNIVAKLLEKNPDDRYQSAAEVAAVLGRIRTELNRCTSAEIPSVLARASSAVSAPAAAPRPYSPLRRASLSLAILVPVLLTGGYLIWRGLDAADPEGIAAPHVGPAAATEVAENEKLARITVGAGSDADCRTIEEAIRMALPGAEITVVGPGPYTDAVSLRGPEHEGIRLRAAPRAIWRSREDEGRCMLAVEDCREVQVSGFDFEVVHQNARALRVTGGSGDVEIEDCDFTHRLDNHKVSLVLVATQPKDETSLVTIERCRFVSTPGSMMCLTAGSGNSASRVLCSHSRFSGPGTLVYVTDACRRLSLRHNIFMGGTNAINLDFREWHADSRLEVLNNTFVESRYWIGLMNSFRSNANPSGETDSIIANNLILGGERVQGGPDQWQVALAAWKFAANVWEADDATRRDEPNSSVASFEESVDLLDRSHPDDADFVVPAPDSELLTAGIGGDLPTYVGAIGSSNPVE